MGTTFTHTTWQVKPGHEDEFVERWREWAAWSHRQGLRAHAGCSATWRAPERSSASARGRRSPPSARGAARRAITSGSPGCRSSSSSFEPQTLEQVAEI